MGAFLSDWREAFVISKSYGMGDPLAPIRRIEEQGGGRLHPAVTCLNDQAGRLGIEEKIP